MSGAPMLLHKETKVQGEAYLLCSIGKSLVQMSGGKEQNLSSLHTHVKKLSVGLLQGSRIDLRSHRLQTAEAPKILSFEMFRIVGYLLLEMVQIEAKAISRIHLLKGKPDVDLAGRVSVPGVSMSVEDRGGLFNFF